MIGYLCVTPGFWIAVEESRHSELRTHPVIIGGLPHQRGTVREVNTYAHYCGVRVGMTLAQAYQLCPDGIFILPDLPRYEAVWMEVCTILNRYTPLVESLALGRAFFDLSGYEHHWKDIRDLAHDIIRTTLEATGIAPCLGIAKNRIVAELASSYVDAEGIAVVDAGGEQAFLANIPLTCLPNVDPRMALTFDVLGLTTIGQFAALPTSAVRQRFGADGVTLLNYARGIDPRPVIPSATHRRINARYECEDGSPEEAIAALHQLADTCATELENNHLAGTMVTLTLIWEAIPLPSQPTTSLQSAPQHSREEQEGRPLITQTVLEREQMRETNKYFPIPYRIHSMLPQPGNIEPTKPDGEQERIHSSLSTGTVETTSLESVKSGSCRTIPAYPSNGHRVEPFTKVSAIVRTAICTAPPLVERAHRLLSQMWSRDSQVAGQVRRLQAIELEVSEFEQPVQLAFAELNQLHQIGGFRGMDTGRLQALIHQEQVLTARYGDGSFRHIDQIDPRNILTERRFRWNDGLPWTPSPSKSNAPMPVGKKRSRSSVRRGRKL